MTHYHTLIHRLRHFGHAAPSARGWRSICSILTHFEEQMNIQDIHTALHYIEPLLTDWPDALRCAPPYLVDRLQRGGHPPLVWPLVRTLKLHTCSLELLSLLIGDARHLTRLAFVGPGQDDFALWSTLEWEALNASLAPQLEALSFNHIALQRGMLRAFMTHPWSRLKRLELWHLYQMGPSCARLLTAQHLPALHTLSIKGCAPLQSGMVEMLAQHGHPSLRVLELPEQLPPAQLSRLAEAPGLTLESFLTPVDADNVHGDELTFVLQRPHPAQAMAKVSADSAEQWCPQLDAINATPTPASTTQSTSTRHAPIAAPIIATCCELVVAT
ncbi:MAG: hypothetical protein AAFS10_20055, partial [Myxococcota bacterium]